MDTSDLISFVVGFLSPAGNFDCVQITVDPYYASFVTSGLEHYFPALRGDVTPPSILVKNLILGDTKEIQWYEFVAWISNRGYADQGAFRFIQSSGLYQVPMASTDRMTPVDICFNCRKPGTDSHAIVTESMGVPEECI